MRFIDEVKNNKEIWDWLVSWKTKLYPILINKGKNKKRESEIDWWGEQ